MITFPPSWTQPQNVLVFGVHAFPPTERAQSPTRQKAPHTLTPGWLLTQTGVDDLPESTEGTPPGIAPLSQVFHLYISGRAPILMLADGTLQVGLLFIEFFPLLFRVGFGQQGDDNKHHNGEARCRQYNIFKRKERFLKQ